MSLTGTPTVEDVSASVDALRMGLEADGYELEVTGVDDKVRFRIVATENACEECLVPKDVMARILAARLQEKQASIGPDDIDITYPAEH